MWKCKTNINLIVIVAVVDVVGRDDLVGDELLEEEAAGRVAVAGGHAVHRRVVRVRYRGVVVVRTAQENGK